LEAHGGPGDAEEAQKFARKADVLLAEPPLTLLLSAQAAQLNGDDQAAQRYFMAMIERKETEFLGLRGLIMHALRGGDEATALTLIERAKAELHMPSNIRGSFAGTAQVFKATMATMPWLFLAAVLAVYIVLGMLYESLIHPWTILSTLPSAGLGALLVCLVVAGAFVGALVAVDISREVAVLFILAMFAVIGCLSMFLREVFLAVTAGGHKIP